MEADHARQEHVRLMRDCRTELTGVSDQMNRWIDQGWGPKRECPPTLGAAELEEARLEGLNDGLRISREDWERPCLPR